MKVDFDSRIVTYRPDQLDQLELAYAVTVHKSQGSEFEAVILVLPEGRDRLSYRSLLYTAVTSAKKLLILVGSPRKVYEMVQNQQKTERYSCLCEMLRRGAPAGDSLRGGEPPLAFPSGAGSPRWHFPPGE